MKNVIITKTENIPMLSISYIERREKFIILYMKTNREIQVDNMDFDRSPERVVEDFNDFYSANKELLLD